MCGCTSSFDGDNSYDNFLTKKSDDRRKRQNDLILSGLSRKDARQQALSEMPKEKLREILARVKAGDKVVEVAGVILDPDTQIKIKELQNALDGKTPTTTPTPNENTTPVKAPMSNTTKIFIGVGIVAVLLGGYFLMKRGNK